jgi:glycosyltransferase involved in cell wall biosynthesis
MTRLSVVMACRNGGDTIGRALGAIVAQEWDAPWELILADNGSTDETVRIFQDLARQRPDVAMRVIDAGARRGRSFALNSAIRQARGDMILLADDDDEVEPGWLCALGAALETSAIVGAATEFRALNPQWVLDYRLWDSARETGMQYRYQNGYLPKLPFVSGHCMGFTRRLFDELGGFDESYIGGQDIDFSLRAQLRGHEVRIVPEAVVHYRFRDTVPSIRRQAQTYAKYQVKLSNEFPDLARPWRRAGGPSGARRGAWGGGSRGSTRSSSGATGWKPRAWPGPGAGSRAA